VPEVRFESFARVLPGHSQVASVAAELTRHATLGQPKVTLVNNEGVSPLSCACHPDRHRT
jgi:hypothetical protein